MSPFAFRVDVYRQFISYGNSNSSTTRITLERASEYIVGSKNTGLALLARRAFFISQLLLFQSLFNSALTASLLRLHWLTINFCSIASLRITVQASKLLSVSKMRQLLSLLELP